jgi:hypothetical protein
VFKQSNSLSGDFEHMLHAQEVVYVLAFQAPSAGSIQSGCSSCLRR